VSGKNVAQRKRFGSLREKKSASKTAQDFCTGQKRRARSLRTFAPAAIDGQGRSGLFRRAELSRGFAEDFCAVKNRPARMIGDFRWREIDISDVSVSHNGEHKESGW
jgi:hypothetical protein